MRLAAMTSTLTTIRSALVVMATVIGAMAAVVSIIAFFQGGPEAVTQTWTFVINIPPAVTNVAVAAASTDVSEVVENLKRLVELAEVLCEESYPGRC